TAPIQVTFDHHMPEVALRELAASNRRSTKNSSRPVGALGKGHWSTTLARLRIATEALLLGANSSSAFCFCTALRTFSSKGMCPRYCRVTSRNFSHALFSLVN